MLSASATRIVANPLSSPAAGTLPAWDQLRERFIAAGEASEALGARCDLVERAVIAAYESHLAPAAPRGLALLAVGGFGRRELFPYSDVDLLLLAEKPPAGEAREALSAFLRTLWDSGLRLSHSVRSPRECCELHNGNIELNISLLDQRLLAGDRLLHDRLTARLPQFLRSQRGYLMQHLCRLARPRHAKYQNTIYHLEPNVKESPGGLRDLNLLDWLDKLRDDPLIRSTWLEGLEKAREFLALVRCFLHFRAGRDDNALTFDAQEELARQTFRPSQPPEGWMRQYYLHARAIFRSALRAVELSEGRSSSLLAEFRQWRSRLSNADFTVSRESVLLKSPHQIAHDPETVLRLFRFLARHGLKLAFETERRIGEALPLLERHYAERAAHWTSVLEVLALPHPSRALAPMNETGVLGALFPEWKRIECLVVRDFYHRYTVDEHTLRAIQSLEELRSAADPVRRRFADLFLEIERPDLLRFALLFHDVGKGEAEGRHVERSLELAEEIMERIQLPLLERRLVRFLIERHLDLSSALTSRDLDDPATARFLAGRVETAERLKYLTLLTYADISAVNPAAMSPWRLELLWRLYLTAYHELTRELATDRIGAARADSQEKSEFLEGLPVRYLRIYSDEEIEKHLELARRCRERGVAVELTRRNGVYSVTIVGHDRPFLFASMAGALAGLGMNILKAEAFTNKRGFIVDTFVFEDPARTLDLNPTEAERLCLTLERVILRKLRARDLLQNRPKRLPPSKGSRIQARVAFESASSETATLIEIVAQDRPGLLYDLARAISEAGCNIELVLIDTEAHKAIDVFYVTYEGAKLTPEREEELKRALLQAAGPEV
jgi:[protein-PII] uridylyltransferase